MATRWAGPEGASAVGAAAGPGLEGADRVGTGVAGEVMAGPKGSCVNPKGREIWTGTGILESKAARARPRAITGDRALGLSGMYGSRANTGARASRVTDK